MEQGAYGYVPVTFRTQKNPRSHSCSVANSGGKRISDNIDGSSQLKATSHHWVTLGSAWWRAWWRSSVLPCPTSPYDPEIRNPHEACFSGSSQIGWQYSGRRCPARTQHPHWLDNRVPAPRHAIRGHADQGTLAKHCVCKVSSQAC